MVNSKFKENELIMGMRRVNLAKRSKTYKPLLTYWKVRKSKYVTTAFVNIQGKIKVYVTLHSKITSIIIIIFKFINI